MLCRSDNTDDLSPGLKRLAPGYSILFSGQVIAAEIKEVVGSVMGGKETLHLSG
jgi:hypothetical protein